MKKDELTNQTPADGKPPVRRRTPEWAEKEIEMLMNYVEADDSETIYERLDFARYMLHYESGFNFPSRSMYDVRKMFYAECKKRGDGQKSFAYVEALLSVWDFLHVSQITY